MMRALAEFIMRGRLQAAVLALLSIPFLTHGAIGLVALRKGTREGALMVGIALIPALASLAMGRPSGMVFWATLFGLLTVYIPAICLRATMSWSFAVQACLLISVLTALIAPAIAPGMTEAFSHITASLLAVMQGQQPTGELPEPSRVAVTGLIALGMLFNGLTGVILARWWQALLYNPGGFGGEFREFRLGLLPSLLCLVLLALSYFQGSDYSFWTTTFAGPLMLVAIAVVHNVVKSQQLGGFWLAVFYTLMVVFSPILLVLAIVGFIDSWLNIRSRFAASDTDKQP
jgi:uncharacterized protein YybS (DUF2232 family)